MSTRPAPSRKQDIHSKLRYAETRRGELLQHIARGYVNGFEPAYLANLAHDILANSRECFDYLAHDLIEGYVIPHANDQWRQQYAAGKTKKLYFPFFMKQVDDVWKKFAGIDAEVIKKLRQLIDAMNEDKRIDNTLFDARDFRVVQGIVNSNKHVKVSVVRLYEDTLNFFEVDGIVILTKIESNGRDIRINFIGGNDKTREAAMDAIQGTKGRKVGEYKFEANGHGLTSLCLFAVHATMIVMDWWYETMFAPTGYRINDYLPENRKPSTANFFPRFRAQPGQTITATHTPAPEEPRLPWQFETRKTV